jgi:hypothetical protein
MTRADYLACPHLYCRRGNDLPHARLTPDLVREIRRTASSRTARQWAESLGLHVRTIEGVRSFRTWRHVR